MTRRQNEMLVLLPTRVSFYLAAAIYALRCGNAGAWAPPWCRSSRNLLQGKCAMSLRINDIAPDFTAETTQGTIKFHEWIGDSWVLAWISYSCSD